MDKETKTEKWSNLSKVTWTGHGSRYSEAACLPLWSPWSLNYERRDLMTSLALKAPGLFSSYSSILIGGALPATLRKQSWREGPCACCQRNNRIKGGLVLQIKGKGVDLTSKCLQGKFSANLTWSNALQSAVLELGVFAVLVYIYAAVGQFLVTSGQLTFHLKTSAHQIAADRSPWNMNPSSYSENWLRHMKRKSCQTGLGHCQHLVLCDFHGECDCVKWPISFLEHGEGALGMCLICSVQDILHWALVRYLAINF